MKIKKIQLKEYKRFFDLTIDLGEHPKRIIALVGPNGCGKSSVFDSMLFFNNAYQHLGNTGNKPYTYHSLNQQSNYGLENIYIDFDDGELHQIREAKAKEGKENTVFSFRSSFRYSSTLNVTETHAVSELCKNGYGASSAADIDQRIEENYRRLNIYYNNYLNSNDCKPSEAKKHILGELNNAINNCLNVSICSLGNIEAGKGSMFFEKKDTPTSFDYNVLSSGEKEVVDILLDLYLRKDEYDDSIYIIDEPELHLNTSIQRKLLIEINKIIPSNCQIWIATHSIGFLRALQEDLNESSDIVHFDENNNWASEAYCLYPIKKTRYNWRQIFATALDDLTELISPRRIVYCEGRWEPNKNGGEQGLDAEVYNTIFSESYPNTLFISSGGNTELDQRSDIAIKILSKAFKGVEVLVLKDRDMASGKKTTEKERQLYLSNHPGNHRVLKRLEIENYLYDKEVLKKYCTQNNLHFDEVAFDSFVYDIINQPVKDDTGRIKKICGIIGSINQEIFKKNLAKCIDPTMEVYKELEGIIIHGE